MYMHMYMAPHDFSQPYIYMAINCDMGGLVAMLSSLNM